MTNSAQIINFPEKEAEPEQEPPKVATLDDGYTRIANELLEAAISHSLTLRQLRVLLAVIRKTYGFNKKQDVISGSQLAQVTKMTRQKCSTALCELVELNIIIRTSSRGAIKVNTHLSQWLSEPKTGSHFQNGFSEPNSGSQTEPNSGSHKRKERQYKDNKRSCPEQKSSEPQEPMTNIKLPLNKKDTYHQVSQKDFDLYQELYPAVDVLQAFREMYGWLHSNSTRRKTQNGIKKFITSWLSKEQNRGGNHANHSGHINSNNGRRQQRTMSPVEQAKEFIAQQQKAHSESSDIPSDCVVVD